MNAKFLIFAGLAATLAACSNDGDAPASGVDKLADTPVKVAVSVNDPASRAAYDNDNLPTAFVMYLKQSADLGFSTDPAVNCNYNYANVRMEKSADGLWAPANTKGIPLLWKSSTPSASLIAFTPLDDTAADMTDVEPSDNSTVSVSANQNEKEGLLRSDWLYVSGDVNPDEEGSMDICFSHGLSKLNVVLNRGTELDKTATFSGVTVSGCGCAGKVNLRTGSLLAEGVNDVKDISMYKSDAATDANWECIMIPQEVQSLSIKILASDGKEYIYTASKPMTFEQYRLNTLTLTVGYDRVVVSGFTAEPWGNDENAGNVETE